LSGHHKFGHHGHHGHHKHHEHHKQNGGNRNQQPSLYKMSLHPRFINLTKSSFESISITSFENVVVSKLDCKSMNVISSKINITDIKDCNVFTKGTHTTLNNIQSNNLTVTSDESNQEKPFIQINNVESVKYLKGEMKNGDFKLIVQNPSSTIFEIQTPNDKTTSTVEPMQGLEWFRNTQRTKQGKVNCNGNCLNDVHISLKESGTVEFKTK